jgi:predicted RNA-binding Zn-ribbon protein involved in translation (DUF1610 family)
MRKCTKITFSAKKEADSYISVISNSKARNAPKKRLRSYQCPMCGNYHLTSESKKEFKTKREEKEGRKVRVIAPQYGIKERWVYL